MSSALLIRPADLSPSRGTPNGTYFVQTWGCQMNVEDSEQIDLYLQSLGLKQAESMRTASVILLNTCSVRRKPEDKAFSLLGELAIYKRNRPDVVIGVCGCMAQLRADEIRRRAPHVNFVVGTAQLSEIPGLVEQALQSKRFEKRLHLPERTGSIVTDVPSRQVARTPKLKAFVPIQYGCDKFCTFCIVPTTRGRERSRPTDEILEEVRQLVANGTREVTLLGQTVNSYGKNLAEGRVPFSALLWRLAEISGLQRIRFTSPYPRDFKTDLIETIRDCPAVMEHVHMPLQSGDDQILKAMHRLYSRESFAEIVEEIRQKMPTCGLTTDVIVGFPGETEEQFQNTLEMMERIRFDAAYMFIYSPRPGTPAGDMPQIPLPEKQERLARLKALQDRISLEKNIEWEGRTAEVLIEGPSAKTPGLLCGWTREFKTVHLEGSAELAGQVAPIIVKQGRIWGFESQLA